MKGFPSHFTLAFALFYFHVIGSVSAFPVILHTVTNGKDSIRVFVFLTEMDMDVAD